MTERDPRDSDVLIDRAEAARDWPEWLTERECDRLADREYEQRMGLDR